MNIIDQLKRDEGMRLTAYKCSAGRTTIGYGRNLDDRGISKDEAEYLLANDVSVVKIELAQRLPWTTNLDDARRGVLLNMAFNLGIAGLLGFKNTLEMIRNREYEKAGAAMLQSRWATQVGARAQRLAAQMVSGVWQ